MLDSQFNPTTLPTQGAWIVTRYTNIHQDKPHLEYLLSLTSRVCVVASTPLVHPTVKAHFPNMLTYHDSTLDLPDQIQIAWKDGQEVDRWVQPQSLAAFARSSSARRQFQKRWGLNGMKLIQKYKDATLWNRMSPLALLGEFSVLVSVQWFALIPNPKIEKFVLDNGIQTC